ncbi:MAG TPA: hypothetical protein VF194_19645 [Ferrovibrio sp.]|uniref:hypothetical protein n=1 Tax=Ferrovibrio sp. TaxID=1917215 RepID=UPI002ED0084B
MSLLDILDKGVEAAGSIFTAKANADAAAMTANQQGEFAILQAQQQANQQALQAQTTQRVAMYVALAFVGLVAFMMLEKKAR